MKCNQFEEGEIPYETLEKFGLTHEMIEDLPMHVLEDIWSGRQSPVLPIHVTNDEGELIKSRTRFSFVRMEDGKVDVMFYPVLKYAPLEQFDDNQQQLLKDGKAVVADVMSPQGTMIKAFVQIDPETNQVMNVPTPVIGRNLQVLSEELGLDLKETTMAQLGRAKSVKVAKENTVIVGGMGDKDAIANRVAQIRGQIEETKSEFDKEKLQERLAKLAGGVAVIRVGASTETEMKEAKLRLEDALAATRAAVEEGIIAGGGSAYIHASKEVAKLATTLEGDEKTGANIILKALEAPLFRISANAGLEGSVIINKVRESEPGIGFDALNERYVDMVSEGILDPAKVTRSALQNATSVASTLLTTESAVAIIKEDTPAPAANPGMGMM